MGGATWKMGTEVKCSREPGTVEVTVEEFQALVEARVKLDVVTRHMENNRYMDRKGFCTITGFEVMEESDGNII